MKRAVVVFSGGQDSTTCLVQALQQYDEVHCVTFDYGQRHRAEIDVARELALKLGARAHKVLDVTLLNELAVSSLTRDSIPVPDYEPEAVGNASNMVLFNELGKGKIAGLNISDPPGEGMSITDYLSSLVSKIGSGVDSIKSAGDAQDAVLQQAQSQRDELYGVDLNEELADLIKYQRAYEASARVFTVANELMQTIMQMI